MTDRELVERADAVVAGRVVDATSRLGDGGYVVTDYRLRVEQTFKGSVPAEVVISEVGGVFAGRFTVIADAPAYARGEHVLVFVKSRPDGTWFTAAMSRGRFAYSGDRVTLTSSATESAPARVLNAAAFERFVRDTAAAVPAGTYAAVSALAPIPTVMSNPPASAYCLMVTDDANVTLPVRIQGGESGSGLHFYVNGTQASVANAATLIASAEGAWTGDPNSGIVLNNATGTDPTTTPAVDGHSVIYLGSSVANAGLCDGGLGCAIISGTADHSFSGENFHSISEADILIRPAVGPSQFGAVMTHELGHAIGLRHADQGTPSSAAAIMTSTVQASFGTNLQQYDKDAVDTVYGSGPPCVAPAVTSQTNSTSVNSGAQPTLTVNASGSTPFTYQWYIGQSGDTSSPINGATASSYQTPALTQTRSFWVKVSNTCGSANSATITMTVTPCTAPAITVQPAPNTTINSGGSATLTFTASGTTPLTIQWYAGTSGDTTNPVAGANNSLFVTPALTQQTSYWAKVTNSCGSANTSTATVSIAGQCLPPSITTQPKDVTINVGDALTLTVAADNATSYQWYSGGSGDTTHPIAGATTATFSISQVTAAGPFQYWVKVTNNCGSTISSAAAVTVKCVAQRLVISLPGAVLSTVPFTVQWNGNNALSSQYELQESSSADFSSATTFVVTNAAFRSFGAKNVTADTRLYYRVRPFSLCDAQPGQYSPTGTVLVTAPPPPTSSNFNFAQPPCNCTITQNLQIPGFTHNGKVAFETQDTFSVSSDSPFVTVTPSSGTLPADGTTVTVTIDTSSLPIGSTQGTLTVTKSSAAPTNAFATSSTTTSIPLTVSLVSATSPTPKDAGPSNTLLVPAVAHADGVGTQFVSDVRVTNTTAGPMSYLLSYTPGGTDGTTAGKQMTVSIKGGDTLALNDIVKSWFGSGVLGEAGIGSIEIRPLDPSASSHATVAASRTYASTATGTFGQFIPALPVANFLGRSDTSFVSLQQIAQSAAYRTNFGFVEGSGQPATLEVKLFDSAGKAIDAKTLSLRPFELSQVSLQQVFPNATLQDGRVEARVISDTGKISAYASVVDNRTNDPLLVLPVDPSKVAATTYVLPGIGDFDIGVAHWKSDVRLYNAGTTAVPATLTYYPQGGGAPRDFTITVQPGEVRVLDNFIASQLTGLTQTAGSLVATAPASASLVATARTYTDTGNGTYGQFIPGVSPADGVGAGERPLQVLQLEESPSFHTNAGVVELTGNPVHVRVHAYVPDGRTSATVELDLGPYQFVQLNRVFASMGYGTVYNGRLAVEATSGNGRITAYGSNIDNRTQDPTYVPAQ